MNPSGPFPHTLTTSSHPSLYPPTRPSPEAASFSILRLEETRRPRGPTLPGPPDHVARNRRAVAARLRRLITSAGGPSLRPCTTRSIARAVAARLPPFRNMTRHSARTMRRSPLTGRNLNFLRSTSTTLLSSPREQPLCWSMLRTTISWYSVSTGSQRCRKSISRSWAHTGLGSSHSSKASLCTCLYSGGAGVAVVEASVLPAVHHDIPHLAIREHQAPAL